MADYNNHKIRVIFSNRTVITLAGGGSTGIVGGSANGIGSNALFTSPRGIAIDSLYVVYVTDISSRVRAIFPNRTVVTVAGAGSSGTSHGSVNGAGTNAFFYFPLGIAVDNFGNVLTADSNNNKIRAVLPSRDVVTFSGGGLRSLWGSSNDVGTNALFRVPRATAVGPDDVVYVADTANNLIRAVYPNQT